MLIFKFEQGDELKDEITNFVGIVTGRSEFFNGCLRYLLEAKKLKEDGQTNEVWFDEPRLKLKKAKKIEKPKTRTHGPRKDPMRHH